MSQNNYKTAWKVLWDTNATDAASFPSRVPTVTEPASDDVILVAGKSTLEIMPFAVGADDVTSKLRVLGWRKTDGPVNTTVQWVPTVICEATCTHSTAVGAAAASKPTSSERLADTIAITDGTGYSPVGGNNVGISLTVDVSHYTYVSVVQHLNSSATSVNALYAAK